MLKAEQSVPTEDQAVAVFDAAIRKPSLQLFSWERITATYPCYASLLEGDRVVLRRMSYTESLRQAHRILTSRDDVDCLAEVATPAGFWSHSVQHCRDTEPIARMAFEVKKSVHVDTFALVVTPDEPWLGCTPDGRFRSSSGEVFLLEIKCPSSRKNKKLTDEPLLRYLRREDGLLTLRKSHEYYTQIQISLFVLGLRTCSFFFFLSTQMLIM